jgi:hypothetical protein
MSDDNMSEEMVFEVMEASSYMGIKPLLELCCLKLTFLIHSKNTEEVNACLSMFNIVLLRFERPTNSHPTPNQSKILFVRTFSFCILFSTDL